MGSRLREWFSRPFQHIHKKEGSSIYTITGKVPYDGCVSGVPFEYDIVMDGIVDFAYRDYEIKVKTCPEDSYYCANDFSPVATGSAVIDPPYISATDGTFDNKIEISFFEYSFNSQAYRVYRSANPTGPYGYIGSTYGDGTVDGTYVDYVSPGTTYYYKGEICTIHGDCSPLSNNYAIGYSSPVGPSGISATDGTVAQSINITWNEIPSAWGYRVYRSETSTPPADVNAYLPPEVYTNSFQDSGADPYTTYYYWIRAYDTNLSDWTDLSASDTGWRTYKAAYNVSASDGTSTDHVDVTWGNYDDAYINQYIVYRSITSDGEKVNLGHSSTTSLTDNLALPGHTYYYWIKSCDELNRCSSLAGPDTGYATLASVGSNGALTASDGTSTDHVLLEWDPVYGTDYYKLYRGLTAGSRPANNFTTSTFTNLYRHRGNPWRSILLLGSSLHD